MRVLFVTTNKHLPEHRGGMEVNTHELGLALLQRSVSVGVLCGLAGVGIIGIRARARRKLFRNHYPMDRSLGYPTWRSYDAVSHIKAVSTSFNPDVFLVQGGADFIEVVSTCIELGRPVICYLHSPDRLPLADNLLESLWFIANSNFTKELHPEKHFLGVVPPIVPPANYSTMTNRACAVFINPAPYKGLDIVFGLAIARPDVQFLFVSNRGSSSNLEMKRPPNVKFIGPVSDMRRVYRCAKLVLAPSQWVETWGRVATEAHLSGVPVLASDTGGLPEAVGPGGLCLPPDAPFDIWLKAFSEIWDNPVRYAQLEVAARHYSQRPQISPDAIVDSFLKMLNSVCGSNLRAPAQRVSHVQ